MSRLVELDARGPRKLDESDIDAEKGDIAICQCGLFAEFPFCDGTHRETRDETDGVCYRYAKEDETLSRRAVDHVVYAEDETDGDGS